MTMYKVYFSGFAYVEADSPDEAAEEYAYNSVYEEHESYDVEEADDSMFM